MSLQRSNQLIVLKEVTMSISAIEAVRELVAGKNFKSADVAIADGTMRYKGTTVLNSWLDNKNQQQISFFTSAFEHNQDDFVIGLLNAALKAQGFSHTAITEDGALFVTNGHWKEQISIDGDNISMEWIDRRLQVACWIEAHNEGDSDFLKYHHSEYLKHGDLHTFCSAHNLTENQALHAIKVAEEALAEPVLADDTDPVLADDFVTQAW